MTASFPIIALVGILSGWIVGASAAGWGALSVPLLILLGVEPLPAISASLAASVVLSLLGGMTHWRYDRSRVASVAPLVLGGMGGSLVGSLVSPALPTPVLRLLIGLTTLIMGILTLLRQNGIASQEAGGYKQDKWGGKRGTVFGIGGVAGLSAGAFGTGWGPIGVTLLVWAGIAPHTVVGSSLLSRSLVAITAAGSYALQAGSIPVGLFLPLLLAGALGVYLGVRTSNGFSTSGMRQFLGGVVTLLGVLTVAKHLW